MNKAFVREPDADGRVLCPRCGTLGIAVGTGPLDTHIQESARSRMPNSAWYCSHADCDVAYFNMFEQFVLVNELRQPVYPYDINAPICACFGLTWDDVDADSRDEVPRRIRHLLEKAKSPDARCQRLAVDGQCCIRDVQQLYLKMNRRQ
mgnify:CR=1 FL=1